MNPKMPSTQKCQCAPMGAFRTSLIDMRASGNSTDAFLIMFIYRLGHSIAARRPSVRRNFSLAVLRRVQKLTTFFPFHIDLPFSCHIGAGLALPHPMNIVLNGRTSIGAGCKILHGVTMGLTERPDSSGAPTIGSNVTVGTGATLIGPVRIGNDSVIGANATVTKDVPSGSTVVGVNRILGGV